MLIMNDRTIKNLKGVNENLVKVVTSITLDLDVIVLEGLRTEQRQFELVKRGASWTMNSKHLTGEAVDLGAVVDGEIRWDWELYYRIAAAVSYEAERQEVRIRWGGVWDRVLSESNARQIADEVSRYVIRRKRANKPARIDGPHFELCDNKNYRPLR